VVVKFEPKPADLKVAIYYFLKNRWPQTFNFFFFQEVHQQSILNLHMLEEVDIDQEEEAEEHHASCLSTPFGVSRSAALIALMVITENVSATNNIVAFPMDSSFHPRFHRRAPLIFEC